MSGPWITDNVILNFFSWLFRGIGDFLAFLVGVGDPLIQIAGVEFYPLDILLAVIMAGIIVFYVTFSDKYESLNKERESKIKDMYIKESPVVERNHRWENVSYLIRTPNPADWKVAIIDADAMLDDLMTRLGYPGATLGDKLKSANTANFPTLNDAWEAHKVRNQIAHTTGFQLTQREALRVYYLFERVFKDAKFI